MDLLEGIAPRPRVHASASLATVLRMAVDGLGIAVVPAAIAAREIAEGQLERVEAAFALPDLFFTASWAAAPAPHLAEALARIAVAIGRESV